MDASVALSSALVACSICVYGGGEGVSGWMECGMRGWAQQVGAGGGATAGQGALAGC